MKINKHNTSSGRKEGFKVIKLQEIKGELIKGNADTTEKELNKETRTRKRKEPHVLNQIEDSKTMKVTCMDEDDYEDLYENDKEILKLDKIEVQNTANTTSNNKELQATTVTKMLGKTTKFQPQAQVDKKKLYNKKKPHEKNPR